MSRESWKKFQHFFLVSFSFHSEWCSVSYGTRVTLDGNSRVTSLTSTSVLFGHYYDFCSMSWCSSHYSLSVDGTDKLPLIQLDIYFENVRPYLSNHFLTWLWRSSFFDEFPDASQSHFSLIRVRKPSELRSVVAMTSQPFVSWGSFDSGEAFSLPVPIRVWQDSCFQRILESVDERHVGSLNAKMTDLDTRYERSFSKMRFLMPWILPKAFVKHWLIIKFLLGIFAFCCAHRLILILMEKKRRIDVCRWCDRRLPRARPRTRFSFARMKKASFFCYILISAQVFDARASLPEAKPTMTHDDSQTGAGSYEHMSYSLTPAPSPLNDANFRAGHPWEYDWDPGDFLFGLVLSEENSIASYFSPSGNWMRVWDTGLDMRLRRAFLLTRVSSRLLSQSDGSFVYRNGDIFDLPPAPFAPIDGSGTDGLFDEISLMSIIPFTTNAEQPGQADVQHQMTSDSDWEMSDDDTTQNAGSLLFHLLFFSLGRTNKDYSASQPIDPLTFRHLAMVAHSYEWQAEGTGGVHLHEVQPKPVDLGPDVLAFVVQHPVDRNPGEALPLVDINIYRHSDELCEPALSDHLDVREVWKTSTHLTRKSFLTHLGVYRMCFEFGPDRCLVHYGYSSWRLQDLQSYPLLDGLWLRVDIPVADDGVPLALKLQYYQRGATAANVLQMYSRELALTRQRRLLEIQLASQEAQAEVDDDLDDSSLLATNRPWMLPPVVHVVPRRVFVIYSLQMWPRLLDSPATITRQQYREAIGNAMGASQAASDWNNFECYEVKPKPRDLQDPATEAFIFTWPFQIRLDRVQILVSIVLFWESDQCLHTDQHSERSVYSVPDSLTRDGLLHSTSSFLMSRLSGQDRSTIVIANVEWIRESRDTRLLFNGMYIQIRCPTPFWHPPLAQQMRIFQQGGLEADRLLNSGDIGQSDTGGTDDPDVSSLLATNAPQVHPPLLPPVPYQEVSIYAVGTIEEVVHIDPSILGRYHRAAIADLLDIDRGTSLWDNFLLFPVIPIPLDHQRQDQAVYIFVDPITIWPRNVQVLVDIDMDYDDRTCAAHDSAHDRLVINIC